MEIRTSLVCILIAGCCTIAAAGARAETCYGRIESTGGQLRAADVSFTSAVNRPAASRPTCLRQGEKLDFRSGDPKAFVKVTTLDSPDGMYINGADTPWPIGGRRTPFPTPARIAALIDRLRAKRLPQVMVDTTMRGGPAECDQLGSGSPSASGLQYAPARAAHVALVWTSPAASLHIEGDGKSRQIDAGGRNAVAFDLADTSGVRTASFCDGGPTWRFQRTEASPPRPQALTTPENRLTEPDRFERAVWILTEGPIEWRAFALGEIDTLARDSYDANLVWRAAASGELWRP
jgi:hypothetical protein